MYHSSGKWSKPEENRPGIEDEESKVGSKKSGHQPNHVICRETSYLNRYLPRVR
jgi:hypothetical protein